MIFTKRKSDSEIPDGTDILPLYSGSSSVVDANERSSHLVTSFRLTIHWFCNSQLSNWIRIIVVRFKCYIIRHFHRVEQLGLIRLSSPPTITSSSKLFGHIICCFHYFTTIHYQNDCLLLKMNNHSSWLCSQPEPTSINQKEETSLIYYQVVSHASTSFIIIANGRASSSLSLTIFFVHH